MDFTIGERMRVDLIAQQEYTIPLLKRKLHQLALAQLLYNEKSAIVFANTFIEVTIPRQSHG